MAKSPPPMAAMAADIENTITLDRQAITPMDSAAVSEPLKARRAMPVLLSRINITSTLTSTSTAMPQHQEVLVAGEVDAEELGAGDPSSLGDAAADPAVFHQHVVEEQGEGQGGYCQPDTAEAHYRHAQRRAHRRRDGGTDQHAHHHRDVPALGQLHYPEATNGGEGDLAQGYLATEAGEHHDGQEDDGEYHRMGDAGDPEVVGVAERPDAHNREERPGP